MLCSTYQSRFYIVDVTIGNYLSVSVSASYCIPQCVRLIAGVSTHYVVYNISKKKNTVDKSKIKDKRKVKPKDKSWVKIGWRTKNRKGWCVQKR